MFDTIKSLFSSKKFWTTVLGTAVTAGLHYAGAPEYLTLTVGGLFGTSVAAQGAADFGKEAEKVKN